MTHSTQLYSLDTLWILHARIRNIMENEKDISINLKSIENDQNNNSYPINYYTLEDILELIIPALNYDGTIDIFYTSKKHSTDIEILKITIYDTNIKNSEYIYLDHGSENRLNYLISYTEEIFKFFDIYIKLSVSSTINGYFSFLIMDKNNE